MSRIALLQELRRMKFSEYYARTKARKLTQIEAASLLGMSERSFRRYGKRFEADGADGLFDRRLAKVPQNRVPVFTNIKHECCCCTRIRSFLNWWWHIGKFLKFLALQCLAHIGPSLV